MSIIAYAWSKVNPKSHNEKTEEAELPETRFLEENGFLDLHDFIVNPNFIHPRRPSWAVNGFDG